MLARPAPQSQWTGHRPLQLCPLGIVWPAAVAQQYPYQSNIAAMTAAAAPDIDCPNFAEASHSGTESLTRGPSSADFLSATGQLNQRTIGPQTDTKLLTEAYVGKSKENGLATIRR